MNLRPDASRNELGLMPWSEKSCIRRESLQDPPNGAFQKIREAGVIWHRLKCLLSSCDTEVASWGGLSIRLLLADCNRRHRSDGSHLRSSTLGKHMCLLGSFKRLPSLWPFVMWGLNMVGPFHLHGKIHEVDQSEASHQDHRRAGATDFFLDVVHILIWHPKLLLHLVHGEGFPQPLSWIPHSSQLVRPLCLIHGGMTRTSPTSQ